MEYIKKADLLARYEEARKGPAISLRKLIEEAETADLPPRRSPLKSDKTEEYLKELGWKPKRKRYQALTPEDVVTIAKDWADDVGEGPQWCKGVAYDQFLNAYTCPPEFNCEDCLKAWLEEEI